MPNLALRTGVLGCGLTLAAGIAEVGAYAPFQWRALAVLMPALLMWLWLEGSPKQAFRLGYCYGLGKFGFGVSWIYNSIYEFGQAPIWLAGALTGLFVLVLALFPAFTGLVVNRFLAARARPWIALVIGYPAVWTLFEWLRGWLLTGFPWLLPGQAHVDTPLAGIIPVLGVNGATWLDLLTAGLIAWTGLLVWGLIAADHARWRSVGLAGSVLVGLWGGGLLLERVAWSEPIGERLRASLIQGDIAQDIKWLPEQRRATLELYRALTQGHWDSDLILWPEGAIPAYYEEVADFIQPLAEEANRHGAVLLSGLFAYDPVTGQSYNSLAQLNEPVAFYHKRHLVPFGEYLPFRELLAWMDQMLIIPMADLSAGQGRPLLMAGGVPIGASICYEDAYGVEVRDALPEAELLVNVSNDAWFGDSLAPHQHLEIARLRALETRRYLLRATNTGVSAVIAPSGRVVARAPQFTQAVLTASVQRRQGATPFSRWGEAPLVMGLTVLLLTTWALARRRRMRAVAPAPAQDL